MPCSVHDKRLGKAWQCHVQFMTSGLARLGNACHELNMAYLSSLKNRAIVKFKKPSKTAVVLLAVVKFKKPSKTAVVLLAGVTISGTPCPRHFTVPFGAEAPSGHVAQA